MLGSLRFAFSLFCFFPPGASRGAWKLLGKHRRNAVPVCSKIGILRWRRVPARVCGWPNGIRLEIRNSFRPQLWHGDGNVLGRLADKWLIARVILFDGARDRVRHHFQTSPACARRGGSLRSPVLPGGQSRRSETLHQPVVEAAGRVMLHRRSARIPARTV